MCGLFHSASEGVSDRSLGHHRHRHRYHHGCHRRSHHHHDGGHCWPGCRCWCGSGQVGHWCAQACGWASPDAQTAWFLMGRCGVATRRHRHDDGLGRLRIRHRRCRPVGRDQDHGPQDVDRAVRDGLCHHHGCQNGDRHVVPGHDHRRVRLRGGHRPDLQSAGRLAGPVVHFGVMEEDRCATDGLGPDLRRVLGGGLDHHRRRLLRLCCHGCAASCLGVRPWRLRP